MPNTETPMTTKQEAWTRFAAAALTGLLVNNSNNATINRNLAGIAAGYADAMTNEWELYVTDLNTQPDDEAK